MGNVLKADSVSTKVYGIDNKTGVNVNSNGTGTKVATDVQGIGNTTVININNHYSTQRGHTQAQPHKNVGPSQGAGSGQPNATTPPKVKQPAAQPQPTKNGTPPANRAPEQPRISIREVEQRAHQLADASNHVGTDEEAFYNSVTTVPGGENQNSVGSSDTKTMDKRVFLSKDNLISVDKYLKTHQLAKNAPFSQAGGIRSYVNAEFDTTDRTDFYNNKMRELVNLLDQYGIK